MTVQFVLYIDIVILKQLLYYSIILLTQGTLAQQTRSYQRAKIICDDLQAAKEFINDSMFAVESSNTPAYMFYAKKYSPQEMIKLVQSGKILKCFGRHTTRPSAFNKAYFIADELTENWPPYLVEYKKMNVDYGSHLSEKTVIFLTYTR